MFLSLSCDNKKKVNSVSVKKQKTILNEGIYSINTSNSNLRWLGKKLSTKQEFGTINIQSGKISIDGKQNIDGQIIIDMKSINVTSIEGKWKNNLKKHLENSDFFSVDQFPTAAITFRSNNKVLLEGKYEFEGDLTIKNITHPISFYSSLDNIDGKLNANANVTFDRSKYDVRYGSGKFFENLGDNLILDEISIDISLLTN